MYTLLYKRSEKTKKYLVFRSLNRTSDIHRMYSRSEKTIKNLVFRSLNRTFAERSEQYGTKSNLFRATRTYT